MEQIRQAGGLVTEGGIDGKAPLGEQNQRVRELMSEGNHIFFTWYEGDSVLPEGAEVFPGAYHVNTWRIAYGLEAVRDWLFAQTRPDIDFSCKHEVMLRDDDGSVQPMDVPYFTSRQIAPGTWQILSDGDYSYLVEGETEALVIDSGYGCGNIRAYCQSLTEKPVRRIANTHDHFDHTANNSYFDCAYMSAETKELATLPFPSFQGITFPRDYPIEVIDEGYVFHLGGRDLRTFKIPDHAVGSLAFLDSREGILFCGDELCMPFGKPLNGSVQRFRGYLKTLQEHFDEMKLLAGGPGIGDRELIQRLARNMDYILAGHEGKCPGHCDEKDSETVCEAQQTGIHDKTVIYDRRLPHYPDRHKDDPADIPFKRVMEYAGTRVIYDIRKVYER